MANPVPRVRHPDWLHKKMLEKNDNFKQRRINDMFAKVAKTDIEECAGNVQPKPQQPVAVVTKRKRQNERDGEFEGVDFTKSWRDILGTPPPFGKTKVQFLISFCFFLLFVSFFFFIQDERTAWLMFHKKKWRYQMLQRKCGDENRKKIKGNVVVRTTATLGGFIQRAQRTLVSSAWQVLQIAPTSSPGEYKIWALVITKQQHEFVSRN